MKAAHTLEEAKEDTLEPIEEEESVVILHQGSIVCMYVCISAIMAFTRCYKTFFRDNLVKITSSQRIPYKYGVVLFFIHEGY